MERYSDAWDNDLEGRIVDPDIFLPFVTVELGARTVAQAIEAGNREEYLKEAKERVKEARGLLPRKRKARAAV